ncbi:MAG: 7-cyano-7-deazaguanine synthase QueC [Proteobacteria bacterium]|nr:7-cyano-7-deazaguanine synthase QueC [Pseudomonadota bacterium]NBP15659.1 7-cyano-7-deazaguanine synthase QueC [bacterium]
MKRKAKKNPASKAVVPISGGMDSSVLLHLAANRYDKIIAVSYDYSQKHCDKEINCASFQIESIDMPVDRLHIKLPFFKDICQASSLLNNNIAVAKAKDVMGDPQTVNYVPFRNLMLLSISLAIAENAGASTVFHGAAQADSVAGFWDGSQEFLDQINKVSALNRRNRITIQAPLLDKSKEEIIKLGLKLGVNFSQTWTCYEGEEQACGECTACSLRIKGFINAGIIDPLTYKITIPWSKFNCKNYNKISKY